MRRIAIAAVLLGICCSRPAEQTPPREQLRPTPPPPSPSVRTWSANLFTHGGYSGGGKGYVFMSSEGGSGRCSLQRLSPQKRAAIESALAAAHPEAWKPSYVPTAEQMTDQFYYAFNLKLERSDGSGGSYSVGWQDESFGMLPRDLRRLYDALWAAHEECR